MQASNRPSRFEPASPMKIDAGWKLCQRKPTAAPAVSAARMPASARSSDSAIIANVARGDRAHAGRQPVGAVGEVDDVHHRDDPEPASADSPSSPSWTGSMNGSVMFSTRTPDQTGIAAAANWPDSLTSGWSPPGRASSIAPTSDGRDRAADDPARLLAGGQEDSAGTTTRDQDRQPAQPRHRVVVQVAVARVVHHAEAAGEAGGGRRDEKGDRGRDEKRPEGIELVHREQGTPRPP